MNNILTKVNQKFLVICIAIFSNAFGWGVVMPILPIFAQGFTNQYFLVGWVIGAFGLARLLTNMPTGGLVTRFGRRKVITFGFALWGFMAIPSMLATNIYILILTYFLQGIGSALAITSSIVYVGDIAPKAERGKYLGYFQASFFGSFFGVTIGGFVAEIAGNRAPFLFLSLLTLFSAILTYFTIRDDIRKPVKDVNIVKPSFFKIIFNRDLLIINFATITMRLTTDGIRATLIPLYAVEKLKLSLGNVGLILSVSMLSNFITLLFVGRLIDKKGRKIPLFLGLLTVAVGCYGFSVANDYLLLGFFTVLLGVSTALISPALTTYTIDVSTDDSRGSYVGVYRSFLDFGQLIAPLLVGLILDLSNLNTPFLIVAGLSVLMGFITLVFLRNREVK
jgi:DHA1 family multidrug resistance protein-like MFS transporter